MGDSFGSFAQVAFRSVLIVAVLVPIAAFRQNLSSIEWRRDRKLFVLLLFSCALIGAPLYYATLIVGVGLSSTLFYAGFILGMFTFGWMFSRERFTKDKIVATVLGILGLIIIFNPSSTHFSLFALAMGLLSGIAAALDLVVSQKLRYSADQTTILTWSASVITCIPLAFLFHDTVPPIGIPWVFAVLFAASALAASWLSISGVKLISAGAAGILGLMEIVFGVLFGVVFFAERPSIIVWIGMVLILLAAAIPYVKEFIRERRYIK